MHSLLRRGLAATVAGVCLVGVGVFAVPAAVATIQQMNLDANAQSLQISNAASLRVGADIARDDFTVTQFSLVQWPLAEGTTVSSFFGYRSCEGCSSFHSGIDFTPGAGVPIAAIADGVVVGSTVADGSWGTHVTIEHLIDGVVIRSSYAHMQAGSAPFALGDTVTRGQIVGLVGNTGQSYGAHLHFTIQLADNSFIDPLRWMREHVNIADGE